MKIKDMVHFGWGAWYSYCWWAFLSGKVYQDMSATDVGVPLIILGVAGFVTIVVTSVLLIVFLLANIADHWHD